MITVRQNDMIQTKTRNKQRSKIKIKNWIIRALCKPICYIYIYIILIQNIEYTNNYKTEYT